MDKIRAIAGHPVVYVTEALASYERRHLIAKKVPFIVPGNQLFLPELGIDLREYFRGRAPTADVHLSPATQAVLIATLLGSLGKWTGNRRRSSPNLAIRR